MFETVLRLLAPASGTTVWEGRIANPNSWIQLSSHGVNHSVHRSPCALYRTVHNVLSGDRRVLRNVPRRADRPSLKAVNAANAEAEREKY